MRFEALILDVRGAAANLSGIGVAASYSIGAAKLPHHSVRCMRSAAVRSALRSRARGRT